MSLASQQQLALTQCWAVFTRINGWWRGEAAVYNAWITREFNRRFESETKALDAPITTGKDFHYRLPTEPQAMTIQRENRPIRLVRKHCIYTPVHETGEKDKS